jgi:tetratricopeptide (TPR) repeat protein
VWQNLAECYFLRKEFESATMAFKSALEVQRDARKLYDASTKDGSSVVMPPLVSEESIADTLKRLGKSYAAQQKYDESFHTLLEALMIFQTAYDKEQSPEKQDQVANIIYCIAEVKEADKNYDEAIKLYAESLQLRRCSDKQRPQGKKSNSVHCAMCMAGIGSTHMAKQQYDLAFKAYNEALQCSRRQSKTIPGTCSTVASHQDRTNILFQTSQSFIP